MAAFSARIHGFLVLSSVTYLASQAATLPFDHSGRDHPALISRHEALGIFSVLAMDLCWPALPHGPGFSSFAIRPRCNITGRILNTADHHVDASTDNFLREKQQGISNFSTEFFSQVVPLYQEQPIANGTSFVSAKYYGFQANSGFQSYENIRSGIVEVDFTQPYTETGRHMHVSVWPSKITRARKLLSGTYGRSATAQHVASRRQAPSSWLKKVSILVSALVGLICAVAGLVLCCIRSKRPRQSTPATDLQNHEHVVRELQLRRELGPREFRYSDLAAATDNFAEERKIGRGGFGLVYRGYLSEEDRHVAIKVLSRELSVQGLKEFQAEVWIMSQLRHRNVVRLVGWCGRRRGLALVYELVPGGSLDTHLYNPDRHLTWPQRYKIALQLGSALRYLHMDCDQCVVHGDIKPANIMLDASLDAKLGDFGLARLVGHGAEPQTTQVVAGTVGYIDPEFVSSRRPCAESDVYSFGVVLLEIACGRRPTTPRRPDQAASAALLASVQDMYRRNVILEAADRRLDGDFDGAQMERLLVTGLWCAHHDPVRRPSVAQAVDVLRSEDAELPVLGTMGGSVEILNWEGRAYGDLSSESSSYLDESTETEYLTTEETAYLFPEE